MQRTIVEADSLNKLTDQELVALARDGDKGAYGDLIGRHRPMTRTVAVTMVRDWALAEDLAQEALLQAYLCLDALRSGALFRSWLYGVTLNVCRGYLRSRRYDCFSLESLAGGRHVEGLSLADPAPGPEERAEQRELHRLVLGAVERLSPEDRAATLLFYCDHLSLREAAGAMGVSVGAVKVRLHRARRRLRLILAPAWEQLRDVRPESARRRTAMIPVTVADVLSRDLPVEKRPARIVILLDAVSRRMLPIWIGEFEADAIMLGLFKMSMSRPLTYAFTASLLKAADVTLEQVRVEALKDDVFYAIATVRVGGDEREVDCRPSDAVALALQSGAPIYVSDEVMAQAGRPVPEGVDLEGGQALGRGLAEIKAKWDALEEAWKAKERPSQEQLIQVVKEANRELMAFVFGEQPNA